jgi:hypothetical protein
MERDLPWFALIRLPTLGSRVVRRKLDARLLAAILLVTGIGGAGLLTGCGLELHPAMYTLTVWRRAALQTGLCAAQGQALTENRSSACKWFMELLICEERSRRSMMRALSVPCQARPANWPLEATRPLHCPPSRERDFAESIGTDSLACG